MYWLIDDAETKVSLKEAALLFCSRAISWESDKVRKRLPSATGVELLLLTISGPRLRWLINETFSRGRKIFDLALIPLVPLDEKLAQDINRQIRILNALTEFRLRLRETTGIEPSMNNAAELLHKSNLQEKCSPTTSKEVERRRRERSAFTYVAQEHTQKLLDVHGEFIEYGAPGDQKDIKDSELREYFGRVKGILAIVDQSLADKLRDCWPHIDPIPLDRLQSVDQDDLDSAGIAKRHRRSAKETKVASRKRPGSNQSESN